MPELTAYELAKAEMNAAQELLPAGSVWTHRKSGDDYVVFCVGLLEASLTPVVTYVRAASPADPTNPRHPWVRPAREFLDGRFERKGS